MDFNIYVCKALCSQLAMTELQQCLVIKRLLKIDGRRFGHQMEAVIFCLCGIVVNEDAENRYNYSGLSRYHPAAKDENNDEMFVNLQQRLVDAFDSITERRLHSIYAKLAANAEPTLDDQRHQKPITDLVSIQFWPRYLPDGSPT